MEKKDAIKQELLKQIDNSSDENTAEQIVSRAMIRVKRIKWATILLWIPTIVLFILLVIWERSEFYRFHSTTDSGEAVIVVILPMLKVILIAMISVSVFLTVALYIRSRTLSTSKIHLRLARIEDQLKNIIEQK